MSFILEREAFEAEFEAYYSKEHVSLSSLKSKLDDLSSANPAWSPYRRKAATYEVAAESCCVHVFRHCPFYFEVEAGRHRRAWGFGGIGEWMRSRRENDAYNARCRGWKLPFQELGLLSPNGSIDIDLDHHSIGYDNVLRLGLGGIMEDCRRRLSSTESGKGREFLEAATLGCSSLIRLSWKFADAAETLLHSERDVKIKKRLERICSVARRVPAEPPRTFYEALNTILFMREAIGSLEGVAVSTFGMLDRMLEPFYKADLVAGRIDKAEAYELLSSFLAITDAKFDVAGFKAPKDGSGGDHIESSTTVIIGGCDKNGAPVFNEVTEMILDAYSELKLINPKLNARLSASHPKAYFERLAKFMSKGTNVLSIYNDDVIIPANVKAGKALEDCHLYVGGGCQENILQNCETHSRATMWINLPAVLSTALFPESFASLAKAQDLALVDASKASSFEEMYAAFLGNLACLAGRFAFHRSANERDGWQVNPCPMHSATIDGCVEKAMDWTEGGARYSNGAVDCVGIGTLIDSLYALKLAAFERKDKPLAEFLEMLSKDFEGDEPFRQYLLRRIPKYGQDDEGVRNFSRMVFKDVAKASSGFPNSRGGRYEASLFAFRLFNSFGRATMATPDGRKAGETLSQGMSPSIQGLGGRCDAGQILRSLEPLDLEEYPVVGILDMKMPGGSGAEDMEPVLRRFIEAGGSGLQVNAVSQDLLLDAAARPELHQDLSVRISGYSAYFTKLPEAVQRELIERTLTV